MESAVLPGSDDNSAEKRDCRRRRMVHFVFVILATSLAIVFVAAGLKRASRSTLWLDEVHALQQSRRGESYGRLLVRGPAGQMSPAPLSYVFEKILDDVRRPARYLGLSPFAYYRLFSIGPTALLGLLACFVVWTRIRRNAPGVYALQALLMAGSLGAFYFQHDVFHYATEMRPYALWNSLWFLALVLSTCRCSPPIQAVVLTLTAMAATATVLQIFALGLALAIVMRMEGAEWKKTFGQGLEILLVPSIVALYYSLRTAQWSFETYGSWSGFLKFWLRSAFGFWIITGAACALVWAKRDLRRYAVGPTAMILLLLVGPVAFFAASQKGMVYSPRHYMYWGLAWPAALMVLALAAPAVLAGRARNLRIAACILVVAVAALNITGGLKRRVKEYPPGRAGTAFLQAGSEIREFLRTERPAFIRHDPAMDPVLVYNLQLLAEWIPVSFPGAHSSGREVLIRQRGTELVAVILKEPASNDLARIPVPP
jgi:hypothetical protein